MLTAGVMVLSIVVVAVFFVRLTRPPSTGQSTAPAVTLSAKEVAASHGVPAWSGAIPVINYRDISNRRGRNSVPPSMFARQLAALKASGFASVGLTEVRRLVMHQQVTLPAKPVLITFDDGIASQYLSADPILAKYGFRAVSFLTTGAITDKNTTSGYHLSWSQVEEMQASGRWEFASHTHDGNQEVMTGQKTQTYGPWITNEILDPSGVRETLQSWQTRTSSDLDRSITELVRHTGQKPVALAYPATSSEPPSNDARIHPLLRQLVAQRFPLAFISSVKPPEAVDATTDPTYLPRFDVSSTVDVPHLLAAITSMVPTGNGQGSPSTWRLTGSGGTCSAERANAIRLVAADQYMLCGASINARQWHNYILVVTVPVLKASTVLIAVRNVGSSRIELAIGRGHVVLRQQVDGRWQVIRQVTFALPSKPTHWQITVNGDAVNARCLGCPVSLSGDLRPSVTWGGPAFGLVGQGEVTLSGITVQPLGMSQIN